MHCVQQAVLFPRDIFIHTSICIQCANEFIFMYMYMTFCTLEKKPMTWSENGM